MAVVNKRRHTYRITHTLERAYHFGSGQGLQFDFSFLFLRTEITATLIKKGENSRNNIIMEVECVNS